MDEYIRAHIQILTNQEAIQFVSALNSDGSTTRYTLESFDGQHRVNARSLLGVLYFSTEYADDTYLVNETHNGEFPSWIDQFRC